MSAYEFDSWEQYIYRRDLHGKDESPELIDHFAEKITKPDLGEFCNHHLHQIRKAMNQVGLSDFCLVGILPPYFPSNDDNLDINKLDEDTVRVFLGERWAEVFSLTERLQWLIDAKQLESLPGYMYMLGQAVESLNMPRDRLMASYKRIAKVEQKRGKGLERLWSQKRDVKSRAKEMADNLWSSDGSKSIRTGEMAEKVMEILEKHPDVEKSKLPKIPTIKEWMREVAREKYPDAMKAGPPTKK
jgi:hypothetical protein